MHHKYPDFIYKGKCEWMSGKHTLEQTDGGDQGKWRCRVCPAHEKVSEMCYINKFHELPLHKRECFQSYHMLKKHCNIWHVLIFISKYQIQASY